MAKAAPEAVLADDAAIHRPPRHQACQGGGRGGAAVEGLAGGRTAGIAARRRRHAIQAHDPFAQADRLAIDDTNGMRLRPPAAFRGGRTEQI